MSQTSLGIRHRRPEPGVEVVETARQHVPGLPRLRLAASLLRHRTRLPLRLGRGYLPLILGLVVDLDGRRSPFAGAGLGRWPDHPSACRTGESWRGVRDGRLTFRRLNDDHRRRAPRCFSGLSLPVPVPYAHSAATPAFLQASHAPSVPTNRTAGAETFRLTVADSAATPSSSCSRTLWKPVSPV